MKGSQVPSLVRELDPTGHTVSSHLRSATKDLGQPNRDFFFFLNKKVFLEAL